MASIWQITLSGYDAQAASESGQSATGKIALGTWGSYGHETIQVTLAEPWDVCTLVTATFWPTYPPDHWDTPGIRVALGTDGLLTVPPEATNRPTQTGRVVFEGLADNEKLSARMCATRCATTHRPAALRVPPRQACWSSS